MKVTLLDIPVVFFAFEDEGRTSVFSIPPTAKQVRVPTCMLDFRGADGLIEPGRRVRMKLEIES